MKKNFWKNKRVLVTGHTGFKGSWLCFFLYHKNAKLYGFSLDAPKNNFFSYNSLKIKDKLKKEKLANINDYPILENYIKKIKPEIVFHLAAQSLVGESYTKPILTFNTNVIGTLNILDVLRKLNCAKSVIIATSDKCYENKNINRAFVETDPLGGDDPYSASKAATEIAVNSYSKSFLKKNKTLVATVRAGNVIGGGDYCVNRLFPDIFRNILKRKKLKIRSPNSIRPWQHVLEPVLGYADLGKKLFEGKKKYAGSWNFGPNFNDCVTVKSIIRFIKQNIQDIKFSYKKGKFSEAKSLFLNNSKAKKKLKWKPRWKIQTAVEQTITWANEFKMKSNMEDFTISQINKFINKN